jgi:hypothetical protein
MSSRGEYLRVVRAADEDRHPRWLVAGVANCCLVPFCTMVSPAFK